MFDHDQQRDYAEEQYNRALMESEEDPDLMPWDDEEGTCPKCGLSDEECECMDWEDDD